MSITRKLAVLLLLSLFFGSLAFAQGGATGAIAGAVQDTSGAVIANAKVSVTSDATGEVVRQTKTDTSGLFTATLLPVGAYTVEVNAAGFPVTRFPGVVVRITETTRMTAVIKVSVVKEVVEVQALAEQVDTTDATTGQSISSTTLSTLPLATRNFQQLLDLSAGASSNLNNAAALGRGDVRIDVNGGREDNNNYLIEGVSASDYSFGELTYTPVPNPDSIQEFKVGTSLYDASQGRNGGGNINAILKSGGSRFHGDLWEYFRNSKLDADDFFLGPFDLKQNIFGGDFGGPVGPKAKLGYFYVNYQGTRQRSGDSLGTYTSGAPVPVLGNTAASRAACGPTGLAATFFPNNTLPAYANKAVDCGLDPVAVNLLNVQGSQFGPGTGGGWLIPSVSGTPGNGANGLPNTGSLSLSVPGRYTDNQFTANWDRDFNQGKDRLSWRFFWSDSETYEPFGADNLQVQTGYPAIASNLNFPLDVPLRGRFGSIAETHSFSNALINEFRFGVNVISDSLENVPVAGASPAELGINNTSGAPDMYRFHFSSGLEIGPFPNQLQSALSDSLVYLDTVSWSHGHHSFRFGGEIDRTSIRRSLPVLDNGLLFFVPGADATINYFQNFLLGEPTYGEGGSGDANHDYHIPAYAAFAQDDYRIRPDLTLNLGLRMEWVGAASDSLCHLGNTIPNNANTIGDAFVYPSCVSKYGVSGFTGNLNSAALSNEYATVPEPRIGLAYDVGGKHSTVIRAGYGIYSVREDIGAVDNLSFSPPFYPIFVSANPPDQMGSLFSALPPLGKVPLGLVPTPSFFQGFTGAPAGQPASNGSPMFSGTAAGYFQLATPLHWVAPTTQQWNLTVQRQLGGNWVLELGYVGTKGTRLRSTFDPDQPRLASLSNPINVVCGNIAAGVQCLQPGVATGATISITQNSAANSTARVPFLGINPSAFEAFYPNSDSHYSGLQATVSHHFSKGLYFQSAYTYSKSIDDVSTASVAFLTRVNDQDSGAASRGLSDFDHRQRFVTSFNYALPFLADRHDAVGYVLGSWEVNSVIVAQSGSPITIADGSGGTNYNLADYPNATASFAKGFNCSNALNSGSLATKIANWVNPAAYVPDGPVQNGTGDGSTGFGNSPRNCIIGPKQVNVDFTLGKTFKLGERQSLKFRTEFFNLFNHPSFQNPLFTGTANVEAVAPNGSSGIGQITQTNGTPRLVQFSLKYSF
ncbi:MAG: carboxypeptidase-like regulatory domain-containing protein [Terriglobales bacterium]|jgi:hypothetical protein